MSLGAPRIPARILGLADALEVAFANNREYQTQKESVYLNALALTLARWQFAPRFFGIITGDFSRDSNGDKSGGIGTNFGVNQLLASGARLSITVANNFLKFFSGNRGEVANTLLSGAITQPLLRGFGSHIVEEPLIQAERSVIYQVRAFERYRQEFIVQISSSYYLVLEARNRVTNEYENWQGLVNNLDRSNSLAEGERLARFEVDQVKQDELDARNRFVTTVEAYQTALDRFKVTLSIPTSALIGLDPTELDRLEATATQEIGVEVDDAIVTALRRRLDYLTEKDQLEDSERKVAVAADALRAQLDVSANGGIGSGGLAGGNQPLKFDARTGNYGVGFDVDLPIDRRAQRNSYVSALIAVESQKRTLSLTEDNIRIGVRDSYRQLLRLRESYLIQQQSVKLSEARVESTNALRDAGRSTTRDVLDSQRALLSAQNGLSSALINLAIARLSFASDTGTLRVIGNGRFEEDPIVKMEPPPAGTGGAAAADAAEGGTKIQERPVSRGGTAGSESKNG
jgi:outer membrane protein TolC